MQEVVYRRYKDYEDLPSLVVIDGGKGQLSSALEVIRGLGLHELPVIGLAKREEEIFTEGSHGIGIAAFNSAYPRRSAPLCNNLSPQAARQTQSAFGAGPYRRNWP